MARIPRVRVSLHSTLRPSCAVSDSVSFCVFESTYANIQRTSDPPPIVSISANPLLGVRGPEIRRRTQVWPRWLTLETASVPTGRRRGITFAFVDPWVSRQRTTDGPFHPFGRCSIATLFDCLGINSQWESSVFLSTSPRVVP